MEPKKPLILIVEDSDNLTDLLEFLLSTHGFRSVKTNTIHDLENYVYSNSPDLILMDMLLSGTNGCDGCKTLKANEDMSLVPIIMMSAHPNGAMESKAAGADDFMAKPFEIANLVNLIQYNLRRRL